MNKNYYEKVKKYILLITNKDQPMDHVMRWGKK